MSKNGNVSLDLGDIYDMAAAVKDTTRKAKKERPNSQLAIVWVSNGITPCSLRPCAPEQLVRAKSHFRSLPFIEDPIKLLMRSEADCRDMG